MANESLDRPTAVTAVSSMMMLQRPTMRRPWEVSLRNGIVIRRANSGWIK